MILTTLKKKIKINKNINFKYIHNQSYIILQKELDDKNTIIKELNEYIKKLEYDNNILKTQNETNDYQKIINTAYVTYKSYITK